MSSIIQTSIKHEVIDHVIITVLEEEIRSYKKRSKYITINTRVWYQI